MLKSLTEGKFTIQVVQIFIEISLKEYDTFVCFADRSEEGCRLHTAEALTCLTFMLHVCHDLFTRSVSIALCFVFNDSSTFPPQSIKLYSALTLCFHAEIK